MAPRMGRRSALRTTLTSAGISGGGRARIGGRLRLLAGVAFVLTLAALAASLVPTASARVAGPGAPASLGGAPRAMAGGAYGPYDAMVNANAPTVLTVPSVTAAANLALHISVSPGAICANNETGCAAATGSSRVTLQAQAVNTPAPYWPDVQVAFILETTAYDGVFDHYNSFYGQDACATATGGQGPVCEESNGVPFFIANGGTVAQAIQAANQHSNVSFALVDFFGTDCGDWDDCGDGYKYHVDIPQFIPADTFGSAVRSTFQDQVLSGGWDGIFGLDDNFLHSPSITALYGTIIGSGLDWSPNSHHVIVLIGSTAPRDPSYPEDYYVSAFDHCCSGSQATGWTCEPAYTFTNGASPTCEGWVRSQDGNPDHSIAGLAHSATQCTESIGGVCTIDIIDLWDTATDPLSQGWPTNPGYPQDSGAGPGGSKVQVNVAHVIEAGCDLAAATGGTWNGPAFASCPDGQAGSLQYVPHGPLSSPNTNNPTLFNALRNIGFGPLYSTLAANGTKKPMFTFVPFGNIKLADQPQFTAACIEPGGYLPSCQMQPSHFTQSGVHYLGWNWSTNASLNALYAGDEWTASFNVVNSGPPYDVQVPVDSCTTQACVAGGSGAIAGLFSWANYVDGGNNSPTIIQSFPLAQLTIQITNPPEPPAVNPPPPPIAPPGLPIITTVPQPVIVPTPTLNVLGVSNVSIQATSAGFLGAGFMRVSLKNRPIAMKVAALSKAGGSGSSKFEKASAASSGAGVGRFE